MGVPAVANGAKSLTCNVRPDTSNATGSAVLASRKAMAPPFTLASTRVTDQGLAPAVPAAGAEGAGASVAVTPAAGWRSQRVYIHCPALSRSTLVLGSVRAREPTRTVRRSRSTWVSPSCSLPRLSSAFLSCVSASLFTVSACTCTTSAGARQPRPRRVDKVPLSSGSSNPARYGPAAASGTASNATDSCAACAVAEPLNCSVPASPPLAPAFRLVLPLKGTASVSGHATPWACSDRSRRSSCAAGVVVASRQATLAPLTANCATATSQAGAGGDFLRSFVPAALAPPAGTAIFSGVFAGAPDAPLATRLSRPWASRCTFSCGAVSSTEDRRTTCSSGRTSSRPSFRLSNASKGLPCASAAFRPDTCKSPVSLTELACAAGAVDGTCANATRMLASTVAACSFTGRLAGR